MDWLAASLGFFKALPELISMWKEFIVWFNKVSGNDPQGYIKKVGEAFAQLNSAKTQEEHANAAKAIAQAISGLP